MSIQAAEAVRHLPPEPWGRRMKRAREDVAHLSLDKAAKLISPYVFTSASNISRMESLTEAPHRAQSRSRRQLATVLVLSYGMDPAEFGLGDDDLPSGIDIPARTPSALEESLTVWFAKAS